MRDTNMSPSFVYLPNSAVALREFEAAVALFRSKGIKVRVFEDVDDGVERPDSIFPNNWFSCHDDGTVFVYPMLSECRRKERRRDVLEYLGDTRRVSAEKSEEM